MKYIILIKPNEGDEWRVAKDCVFTDEAERDAAFVNFDQSGRFSAAAKATIDDA